MKKIVWRAQKGWVYLLGIILCLSFAYLGLQETEIKAAGIENTLKQAQKQDVSAETEDKAASSQNITASDSASVKGPKAPTKKTTAYKYVTTAVPVQQGANTVQNQTDGTGATVTPPAAPANTADVKITGLGVYTVEIKEEETAFDALKKAASKNNFSLKYETYSFGVMITKIGAVEAQGTYYWALYYNGGYSNVGASELILNNKDVTEWRYESWQ